MSSSSTVIQCDGLTYPVLSVNTTNQERPRYIGFTGLSWGSGFVLGPVVGGAFAGSSATWRWAFYLNLVLFAVFGPILIFLVPRWDPKSGTNFLERIRHVDWLGSILELGATLSGIMAISFGGTVYAWNSGQTIGLFVTSGVVFALFFIQQHFKFLTSFENRIFPMQFLGNRHMMIFWTLIAAPAAAVLVCRPPNLESKMLADISLGSHLFHAHLLPIRSRRQSYRCRCAITSNNSPFRILRP